MSESEDLRIQSAANPDTSAELLEILSTDQDPEIRCAVAWNQSATVDILSRLANDDDEIVRFCVSGNSNANFEVIYKLAKDESSFVKEKARYSLKKSAKNPNTSPELLESLATDEDFFVRADVATNPNTSLRVLKSLARDEEALVRSCVASAPKTTIEILEFLAKDETSFVRSHVAENSLTNLDMLGRLVQDEDEDVRAAVASNPTINVKLLELLAKDDDYRVRRKTAGNSNVNLEILEFLTKDESEDVRREVANNPNANDEILGLLVEDEAEYVRVQIAENPKTSLESLEILSRDEEDYVRARAASNSTITTELLEILANDEEDSVRRSVARNPNTSLDTLEFLADDEEESVRECVALNPMINSQVSSMLEANDDEEYEDEDVDEECEDEDDEQEGDHEDVEETLPFPGRNSLIEKRNSQLFSEGIALCFEKKHQEGADIFFELAYDGHLESINELVYMFLDQRDFKVVEELLECYPDANNPTILFLRAKMFEAVENLDNLGAEALNAYEKAAIAGSVHAAFTLVEEYATKDRLIAKKWLSRATEIGHPKLQYFKEMLSAQEKQFTIVIGRDNSGGLTQVSVFRYGTEELLRDFDSISEATNFCITSQGGFDFQEDYDESEDFSADYHIKVFPDSNTINIAEEDHDYWFGNLLDMDAALEELLRRDCSWDLVFYDSIEDEVEVSVSDNLKDFESDSDFVDLSPEDFTHAGSFEINSGRSYIGDPGNIEEFIKRSAEENDVWTAYEGLNIFDFGILSSSSEKTGIVYVEENDEGRIVKALISFDGEFEDKLSTEDFVVGNWLLVSSGQLMVGDPKFLENWDTSSGEEWNLEGKIGKFSYQGASATTTAHNFGVLADGKSVVFNTGYGDGNYYVFFLIKNQSGETLGPAELQEAGCLGWLNGFATGVPEGCEISKVVIDFITEVE